MKSLTDDDEDDDEDEDESKGQRRSKDFMVWEANSDKRVKEMTPPLPWDTTVVQKFHTLYPAPEELNFSHLRPSQPAGRPTLTRYRHSVLHDALVSGDSKLAVRISDLTVHTVQLLRTFRQKLAGAYALPEVESSSGYNNRNTVFKLSGYYGTYVQLNYTSVMITLILWLFSPCFFDLRFSCEII